MRRLMSRMGSYIERSLDKWPDSRLEKVRSYVSMLRNLFARIYLQTGLSASLIRLCDFIAVRSFGNRFIEFELSNICNARCVFCPYPDMLKSGKEFTHMNLSVFESSLSKFHHFGKVLVSVTPTTGDTLLHPEWEVCIGEILNHPRVEMVTMFTNAIALDEQNRTKITSLLKSRNGRKLSQIFFSVGGPDAASYKEIYRVDRFDMIKSNISDLLSDLKQMKLFPGIHLHARLGKDAVMDDRLMMSLFNPAGYPFVYTSASSLYYSNDAYKRNALIGYREREQHDTGQPCAYLFKTRFAADGSIWADGCVISELPGDSSLRLGSKEDSWETIEKNRKKLLDDWEYGNELPLPCRGCTMYRPMRK